MVGIVESVVPQPTARSLPPPAVALLALVDRLRSRRVPVGIDQAISFLAAVSTLPLKDWRALFMAGRSTLITSVEDFDAYGSAFSEVFLDMSDPLAPPARPATILDPIGDEAARMVERPNVATVVDLADQSGGMSASAEGVQGGRLFPAVTPGERATMDRLVVAWKALDADVVARRHRPARRGDDLDLRRTLRRLHRTYGEVVDMRWRVPSRRPRRVLLIVDVSGSMRRELRRHLLVARSAIEALGCPEVFTCGTRLHCITGAMSTDSADSALALAGRRVDDWEGGTLLSESFERLIAQRSNQSKVRGAFVIVISDGLERDGIDRFERSVARLARNAHRLVWVSPLAASSTYRPVTRGIRAALPHLDGLVGADSLDDFEQAIGRLAEVTCRRRGGAQRYLREQVHSTKSVREGDL